MIETNAKGIKGFILYSPFRESKHFFRVYKDDGSFLDYDLNCEELSVTIDSDFYSLYDIKGKLSLDFSSEVLGVDSKKFFDKLEP